MELRVDTKVRQMVNADCKALISCGN